MQEYSLLDCGGFRKLEQVGPYRLIRPAAGAVWRPKLSVSEWGMADAEFVRQESGKGDWRKTRKVPEQWEIKWEDLKLEVRLTGFGHLGFFAEHASCWNNLSPLVKKDSQFLNLFAYTGVASLLAAKAGAKVVHVDASKTSIEWAKKNAGLNGLKDAPIRWMLDDAASFVKRELRRGSKYQGILLDPPTYGRGAKKQVWKIEEHLTELLLDLKSILDKQNSFICLTSHSPGYTPLSLRYLIEDVFGHGKMTEGELMIDAKAGHALPSGAYCVFGL